MSDPVTMAWIALIPSIVSIIVGWFNHRQGTVIHTLVNSKMTAALAEIERLKKVVDPSYVKEEPK